MWADLCVSHSESVVTTGDPKIVKKRMRALWFCGASSLHYGATTVAKVFLFST